MLLNLLFVVFSIVVFMLEALGLVVLKPGTAVLIGICFVGNLEALVDN